jgi:hypothetical protein
LRTFFVLFTAVAMILGWISYSLDWIRQRHEFFLSDAPLWRLPAPTSNAPRMLWLFGETGIESSQIGARDPNNPTPLEREHAQEVRALFPEAEVSFKKVNDLRSTDARP